MSLRAGAGSTFETERVIISDCIAGGSALTFTGLQHKCRPTEFTVGGISTGQNLKVEPKLHHVKVPGSRELHIEPELHHFRSRITFANVSQLMSVIAKGGQGCEGTSTFLTAHRLAGRRRRSEGSARASR